MTMKNKETMAAFVDGTNMMNSLQLSDLVDMDDLPQFGEHTLQARSLRYEPPATGGRMLVIVDTSGIHELPVVFCKCIGAPSEDKQLLNMCLYPATVRRPQTAFTFRLLDDFLVTNRECKTPARTYYTKLRRTTNNAFPHMVPVSKFHAKSVATLRMRYRRNTRNCSECLVSGETSS